MIQMIPFEMIPFCKIVARARSRKRFYKSFSFLSLYEEVVFSLSLFSDDAFDEQVIKDVSNENINENDKVVKDDCVS